MSHGDNEQRIHAARILLLTTDRPISEIAAAVGVPDAYHFNRMFHASVGMPPGRFRRQAALPQDP